MISLENAFPLYDEEGMKLTPYTFTIQNKCASYASYNINLELLDTVTEDDRLDPQYLKVVLNENTPTILSSNSSVEPTLSNAYASYELTTGYLEQNEEKTYNLRLWLDENVTLQDPVVGKSIIAKITVTANYIDHIPTDYDKCVSEYGEDSIQCSILSQLDTSESCPTVNEDGTVNVTSAESSAGLLCSAPDDYGTSYYYRGNVLNNYVSFAGYYWRIVRINGDGSIRIVYDGTSTHANGEASEDRQIVADVYNSSYNDNAYIGYMFGATGASTYDETHANTNDSTIKGVIDNWYKTNIYDTGYSNYVNDTLFCDDRSFSSVNTGTGAGVNTTYYRWYNSEIKTLNCGQQNDRFTVDDESIGNGDLTYPVALLTADEVYLAGGYSASNSGYYLYTGNDFWLISPSNFNRYYARVRYVTETGFANNYTSVNSENGIRPVINLKPNSLKSGDGTALNPYLLSGN